MDPVKQLSRFVKGLIHGPVMAFYARFRFQLAIAPDHLLVTADAGNTLLSQRTVIEAAPLRGAFFLPRVVAEKAVRSCRCIIATFEVTDKACFINDRDMPSHGDAGVTGRTPQDLASLQLLEVGFVVEAYTSGKCHLAI
jgi:hypothetical protein